MTDDEAASLMGEFEAELRDFLSGWRSDNSTIEMYFLAITGPGMLNVVYDMNRKYGISHKQIQLAFMSNLEISKHFHEA